MNRNAEGAAGPPAGGDAHSHEPVPPARQVSRDASQPESTPAPPPSPPPARGPRLKILIPLAALCLLMLWAGATWSDTLSGAVEMVMTSLRPTEEKSETAEGSKTRFYTCGMHPWVILPKPGDCPICRMKLTPLDPDKFTGEIAIDPVVVQNMGVRVEAVDEGPLVRTIRTVGNVAYDERRVRDVNLKVQGWIEKLYVDFAGTKVEKGEPLFDLFSRDLYSTQEEYLLALRGLGEKDVGFMPRITQDNQRQAEATRTRLELFGISPEQIAELEKAGHGSQTMTILSPHTGIVTEKHAVEGMFATPGMVVYRIADLSRVWVMVTLYEYQLPYVQLGQEASISLPYIPGQSYAGKVTYIYPWLDPKTRELQLRLEFDNPNLLLKPGMFANVELHSRLAERRTLAPRSAVIDTGDRQIAFVSLGRGKFEPRQVRTGVETQNGKVEIIDGLRPGEMVVTSGQFLLDSEAKMREALGKMIRGEMASEQETVAAGSGPSELTALPSDVAESLERLISAYLRIGHALSSDTLEATGENARTIAEQIDLMLEHEIPRRPHFWHQHTEVATIRGEALGLATTSDLPTARELFADLSVALSKLLHGTGVPPRHDAPIVELHCPMFHEGQGGSIWLQDQGDVRNPFYGQSMLGCFDRSTALPVTGGESTPAANPAPGTDNSQAAAEAIPSDRRPSAKTQTRIDRLVTAYLALQERLAGDSTTGIDAPLEEMREQADLLGKQDWSELESRGTLIARSVPAADLSIDELRVAFKDLSQAVISLVKSFPPSSNVAPRLHQAYCPMAKGTWLQRAESVMNPYYGESMLTCGTIQETIIARPTSDR